MIIPSPSSAPECPLFLLAPTTALREWAGLLWPGVEKLLLLRGPLGSLEKAGRGGGGKMETCHRQMHFSDKAAA